MKGFIRVAERRWDLRMENGVTVKLPEGNEDAAIAELLRMDRESGLLSRDIASVDLRLADRLVVQLTPDAVTRREAALAASAKAARKKPGQKICVGSAPRRTLPPAAPASSPCSTSAPARSAASSPS